MSADTSASLTPQARAISAAVKTSGRIGDWSTSWQWQKGCPRREPTESPQLAEIAAKTEALSRAAPPAARAVVASGQGGDTGRGQRPTGDSGSEPANRATSGAPLPRTRLLRARRADARR